MEYHVRLGLHTKSGRPVDEDRLDEAGGRLATLGPSANYDLNGPNVEVTVMADAVHPSDALRDSIVAVLLAFDSVGEPVTFRRGTVYTPEEFDVSG
jgi:hypothetical protein